MLVALLVVLLPIGVADRGDEAQATAQLAHAQEEFRLDPRSRWQPDAESVIRRFAATTTATRACLWLGAIALEQGRDVAARGWFDEALRRAPQGELAALGQRGLGDVDYRERRFGAALVHYRAARAEASPVLLVELAVKLRAARREQIRWWWELAAWAFIVACAIGFAMRLRGRPLHVPAETWFLLPVYAIFVAAAWGRDPQLRHALVLIALGSLALVTLAMAGGRRHGRAGLVDAALLVAANGALIYAALQRAGMVSALWGTLQQTG